MNPTTDSNITALKNFIRGGQIILHNLRMFGQIGARVMVLVVLILALVSVCYFFFATSRYERYVIGQYGWARVAESLHKQSSTSFQEPGGRVVKVRYTDITHSPYVKSVIDDLYSRTLRALMLVVGLGLFLFWAISRWLTKKGAAQTEDKHLKGDHIATVDEFKKIIALRNIASGLMLGPLPLPKRIECVHFLLHGTPGSGKSTVIRQLLEQIRQRGDRAIIYDKSCNFLEEFFDPTQDALLNPLDERCQSWHLWNECRDSADFDSLAAAQIPMPLSTQDPFWVNAARTIFSAAAFEMRTDPERNIFKLLRFLLTADLERLQQYLKGTEAETLVSDKIEKTAISIKSVLATYLKSMKYIKDEVDPFSIRQWVQNEEAKNWLFITSLGDRHETLKPLITMWLDLAINALLSLPMNDDRRIYIILDEVASLHQLPYLPQALSEARKFGGCFVIGLQNFAQAAKLYGQQGALEISALTNTRVLYRQPDPDMAKWSAQNLGESIRDEVREGISYGANTMRDGISINRVETRKPLVSFSEMMSLPDLQAFVRLPGDYPITRVEFAYKPRVKRNAPFLPRKSDAVHLKEIEQLFAEVEKSSPVAQTSKPPLVNANTELDTSLDV